MYISHHQALVIVPCGECWNLLDSCTADERCFSVFRIMYVSRSSVFSVQEGVIISTYSPSKAWLVDGAKVHFFFHSAKKYNNGQFFCGNKTDSMDHFNEGGMGEK